HPLAGGPARGIGRGVLNEKRIRGAVERREVVRQIIELGIAEAERRHVDLEPGTDLPRLWRAEEAEEPVALHLRPFPLDDRGRQGDVRDERSERSAESLDDVAALAIVVLDDPTAAL